MLNGTPVGLDEMLRCREERAALQKRFLSDFGGPLVSFSLNIPGPVKTTPELRRVFERGKGEILRALEKMGVAVRHTAEKHESTGDEFIIAAEGDASAIKKKMTAIEEEHPLGRLFDIDVIDEAGEKISRAEPRRCFLCGEAAAACARSRRHSVDELVSYMERKIAAYFAEA